MLQLLLHLLLKVNSCGVSAKFMFFFFSAGMQIIQSFKIGNPEIFPIPFLGLCYKDIHWQIYIYFSNTKVNILLTACSVS